MDDSKETLSSIYNGTSTYVNSQDMSACTSKARQNLRIEGAREHKSNH